MRTFLLLLAALPAIADTKYMIEYLLPRGGGLGATVEVEFHGASLENPREIVFYQPGITASDFAPYAKPGDGFKVKFHIAKDCPLGEHVLRVRTDTALSDAMTFWVSRFPTEYEFESKVGENDSIEKAKPVPMNVTVEGQILPGPDMDRDFYKVQATEGQRISVEVESARLGTLHFGGENDLTARILDASGKELAHDDDSAMFVQDPVLSIAAPKTGAYYIEIRQQIYDPPKQAWYRAHIGTFSRPSAIFPAGGQAGTAIEAKVIGDPAGVRTEKIALPAQSGAFDYYAGADGEKPPSPNVLRVSPYANAVWCGEECAVAGLPVALNGILDKPGPQTWRFPATKGLWRVQVFARTLGSPVDPKIWIRAAAGAAKNAVDADDARMLDLGLPSSRNNWHIKDQMDPVANFRVNADGQYILGIEDAAGAAGPDHVYRIEIEPIKDTIYTHITASDGYQIPRLTGLIIPQGGRWTVDVQLAQGLGNAYRGDVELEAAGLPRGVRMIAPRYTKGVNRLPVQFVADVDAEPQSALIQLLARPVDKTAKVESASRQAFALTNRPGELPWHFVFLDQYALAVTTPAPFAIELEQPKIALVQNGELLLKVKVHRNRGYDGPIEIQPDWVPQNVQKESTVTIAKGKDAATFRLQATDKASPGKYKIAMNASTSGTGDAYSGVGRIRVSSAFVNLEVAAPYISIDLQRTSVERGKQSVMSGVLKINRPFEGKATVTLRQLPKGVRMVEPAPKIGASDKEVVFSIAADADALAGIYKGLDCELTFTEAGQTVRQHTGSGTLRVDEAHTASSREIRP